MAEFSKETTYDEENLLSMSKENIKVVLEKRANDIIEREKQVAEEAKEQERFSFDSVKCNFSTIKAVFESIACVFVCFQQSV
jgi:CRISPR/Cas system CMR-associated protein Cmr5 small subunit